VAELDGVDELGEGVVGQDPHRAAALGGAGELGEGVIDQGRDPGAL